MKKFGVLSFIPDAGHVIPMLRIAAEFMKREYEAVCYFPEECKKYADLFNIPMRSLGQVTGGIDFSFMNEISRQSVTKFRLGGWKLIDKAYNSPIEKTIRERFPQILELIGGDDLSLLIADNHHFNGLYRKAAASIGVPIVFHHSEGNLRYPHDELVFCYGYKGFPLSAKVKYYLVTRPWYVVKWFLGRFRPYRKKENPESNPVPEIYISSGIAPVEEDFIKHKDRLEKERYVHFPPVPDKRDHRLSDSVEKWLDNNNGKPVVYVSFGTMVKPSENFMRTLLKGLLMLDIRVLWAASNSQKQVLESSGNTPDLLIEEFLPQPKVLAHENVRCFISHGGAGGIQDSLLAGKPLLCIPFTFDQPYNSSIIMLMNAGIRIKKEKTSAKSVQAAVSLILNDPIYSNSARDIMRRLNEKDSGQEIFDYLQSRVFL
jgi:UDP-N-acetylglucosamine:LPS N-acetylglucosamine transferase